MEYCEVTFRVPKILSPRLRFKLSGLLVLILIFAIGIGAFRLGSTTGYESGFMVGRAKGWSDAMSEKLFNESYRVSDLVMPLNDGHADPDANMVALVDEIEKSVDPASWSCNQGPAEISTYMGNLSLMINQTRAGHEAVTEFLKRKRSGQ